MNNQTPTALRQAVSCVVQEGTRFLLVKRANEPAKGQFAFAGGKTEPGESLEDAVRRELFEETGIIAGEVVLLREFAVDGGFHLHVFFALKFSGIPTAGDDAASVGWFTIEQMKVMPMPQSVYDVASELVRGIS